MWHLSTPDGQDTFDTKARTHALVKGAAPTGVGRHRPAQFHWLAGTDRHLSAFSEHDAKAVKGTARLELQVPDKQKRKVVFADGEYTSLTLFPSPDGKSVAVWARHRGEAEVYDPKLGKAVPRVPPIPRKSTVVVFDADGETVASVHPEPAGQCA